MSSFEELGLSQPIVKAIKKEGFDNPTKIQEEAIPHVLEGRDVIAASKTGSGKTLAFLSGIVDNLERGDGIKALILTPTRELARQVAEDLEMFSEFDKVNTALIYGGVSYGPQIRDLKKADVVIATPGRLLDHMGKKNVDLSHVEVLVLDEADRMFDMGFIDDVEDIIKHTPEYRQTLLFSATMSTAIDKLAEKHMQNPVEIFVESTVGSQHLKQEYYDVRDDLKFSLLVHLLKNEERGLVMVFCNTRRNTDWLVKNLENQGIDATAIHGGLSQDKRERIMQKFHEGKTYVLVCTDVAARGLDIEGVSHIYNYDIPSDPKQYTHRIGRTARAGKEGKAVNILSSRDHDNFRRVMRHHSTDMTRKEVPKVNKLKILRGNTRRKSKRRRN